MPGRRAALPLAQGFLQERADTSGVAACICRPSSSSGCSTRWDRLACRCGAGGSIRACSSATDHFRPIHRRYACTSIMQWRWTSAGRNFSHAVRRGPAVRDLDQTLKQVWFRGGHCDIGGGYADHRLSDIALEWVLDACERTRPRLQGGHPAANSAGSAGAHARRTAAAAGMAADRVVASLASRRPGLHPSVATARRPFMAWDVTTCGTSASRP